MQLCPGCGEENPDKFRLCGFCGTPLAPELPPQEVRKTVTIVFSDLKGSTAMGEKLDSEAVREVMTRYFDEMRAALERHGGTVEKYIGETTYRLVRHAVEVEEVEPLELKGKAERVPAYRLVEVHEAESVERRRDSPLVGRERELNLLSEELAAATQDRGCRRVTIVAQAGVGKSRLIEEFGRSAAASDARLLRGRCLPYGRGITFWPLVEIVRHAAAIEEDDSPEAARAKLGQAAGPGAHDVVDRVASAVGLGGEDFPLDEIFWGTRKFFEHQATEQALVVL